MIDIHENTYIFLIPPNLKDDIQVQCVGFAIDTLFQNFIQKCHDIAIWSDSTNWNDTICDQLAVELRTPLYSQNLDLESKKEMVKETLEWFKMLVERIKEVKNVRSSLERFLFIVENNIHVGAYAQIVEKIKVLPYQPKVLNTSHNVVIAITFCFVERIKIKFKQCGEE